MTPLRILARLDVWQHYSGLELHPGFLATRFGCSGDAAVLFPGSALVEGLALVDLEDRANQDRIVAIEMLHLIVERKGVSLEQMVLLQRLLAALCVETLRELLPARADSIRRSGDDVFVGDGKFSVSIATTGPVSALLHFAVNVDATGAPVTTSDLERLGIERSVFVEAFVRHFETEQRDIESALVKVAPAHEAPGHGA